MNSFIFSPKSLPLVIFTANESFSRLGGNEKVGGKCLNKMKKLFKQVVTLLKGGHSILMSHHQSFSQKIISQHSSHALTSLRPQTILFSHRNWVTIWFISLAHTDLSKLSATPGSGGPLSIQLSLPGGALIGHHFFYSATTRKISISSAAVLDISPPEN